MSKGSLIISNLRTRRPYLIQHLKKLQARFKLRTDHLTYFIGGIRPPRKGFGLFNQSGLFIFGDGVGIGYHGSPSGYYDTDDYCVRRYRMYHSQSERLDGVVILHDFYENASNDKPHIKNLNVGMIGSTFIEGL